MVLVAIHWWPNNRHAPDKFEMAGGHALIDAGADAVLGTSAHVLQGVEVYKTRPNLHDAGDLLFDALTRSDSDNGVFISPTSPSRSSGRSQPFNSSSNSSLEIVIDLLDLSRFDAAPLIAFTACMDTPIGARDF